MNRHQRRKDQKEQTRKLNFQKTLLNAIDLHSRKQFKEAEIIYKKLIKKKLQVTFENELKH